MNENNISYMVSGSIAMNVYSIPRMTRDIDIVIEIDNNRIDHFLSLFPDSYYNYYAVKEEIKKRGFFKIIDNLTGFKIDFIVRKNTEYFYHAFNRRIINNDFDIELWIITIEDLIIAKLIWIQDLQSDIQMNDIKNLLRSSKLDMEYLNQWTRALKLNTFNLIPHE